MSEETIKSAAELAAERAARVADESPETPAAPETASTAESAELAAQAAHLAEELESQKDKHLRLVAEFDNFRRRSAREFVELQETAAGKAFAALFPVLDNFERAFADPATGEPVAEDWVPADPAAFARGLRLVRDQLRKVLTDAGVEEIAAQGSPFDPNLHDALTQMPHPSVPAEHVAAVHARGWKKGEKVLRHAQVVVSSGPAA